MQEASPDELKAALLSVSDDNRARLLSALSSAMADGDRPSGNFDLTVKRLSGEELQVISGANLNWTRSDVVKRLPPLEAGNLYKMTYKDAVLSASQSKTLSSCGVTPDDATFIAIVERNEMKPAYDQAAKDLKEKMTSDPNLIEEIVAFLRPPPRLETLEELICRLLRMTEGKTDDTTWHQQAQATFLKLSDPEAFVNQFLAVNLDTEAEHVVSTLADLEGEDLSEAMIKRCSLFYQFVLQLLNAMYAYSKVVYL